MRERTSRAAHRSRSYRPGASVAFDCECSPPTPPRIDPDDPLSGLVLGERPDPIAPDGWVTVRVKAASLNHHDLWSLRGVGLARRPPADGARLRRRRRRRRRQRRDRPRRDLTDPAWRGDETLDPRRSILSERHPGSFAELALRPPPQHRAQASRAVLRAGRLPPDRLADGLPDALHPGRPPARQRPSSSRAPAAASRPR